MVNLPKRTEHKSLKGDVDMKESYAKPQSEVSTFKTVDVITTSGTDLEDKRKPIELPDL
jgi:hypothetical protein